MKNTIKNNRATGLVAVFVIVCVLLTGSCKDTVEQATCVSEFYYEGSPFRQGADLMISPSYHAGENIPGEFSSSPGLVIADPKTGAVDLAASTPGVYTIRKAMIGNPTCGNRIALGYIAILPPPTILSNADNLAGWGIHGAGRIDTEDKKEGEGSIKNTTAGGLTLMQYSPPQPVNTRVSAGTGELHFWFYISDPTKFDDLNAEVGQFELTSGGGPDAQEFTWKFIPSQFNFNPGWNEVKLKFREAELTGGTPDLSAINFFRIYMFTASGEITIGIDDMRILAEAD